MSRVLTKDEFISMAKKDLLLKKKKEINQKYAERYAERKKMINEADRYKMDKMRKNKNAEMRSER